MKFGLPEDDIYLFHQGTNYESQRMLGSHYLTLDGVYGCRFTVWAPHASSVALAGDFNNWSWTTHTLELLNETGLWGGFFEDIPEGSTYKYAITHPGGWSGLKADPFARQAEVRPATASVTPFDTTGYVWKDQAWQKYKESAPPYDSPVNIYEVHFGTWKQKEDGTLYDYEEMADLLIPYVKEMGYTHIELLPLAEHPFDLSWGYQITGYFAVTSRYGTPNQFKYFVDKCHQAGIGVIMDWVPGHFCKDDHGLRRFDGEALFEYNDDKKADKPSWGTLTFDFGKPEIQSFLVSNAIFWMKEFHIDGIRADAVASMLYLNFDRLDGEPKIFNSYGGEENLEALAFLRKLNEAVFAYDSSALMMAEDSSDIPLVTSPTHTGGLGFNYKWNMGWMNDMLRYMEYSSYHRRWHHNLLTFSFMYAFSENYVLPLSHDEVVHGKKSMLDKMPGDQWQQFAQLRLFYGYQMTHPGKKLLFMGGEFGQYAEWKDKEDLDWLLLDYPLHAAMKKYVKTLNHFYKSEPALFEMDHESSGFEWIDPHNSEQSIIAFIRRGRKEELVIVCNFTPEVYYDYKIGVPSPGTYTEVFNTDEADFGGSNQLNEKKHFSYPESWHGQDQHILIKVPPFAAAVFKKSNSPQKRRK
ncbi:1,4-alpha-glucan branching protein GlgB [Alkalicoccus saliphilus]|jgi:1,4-alpha-glucan branching enzyme|uniref:1,4-alpha-glucan branching enzyme GlgB n=1 Tax=Alkalicoccus saliphilus TaxID=200989 RepID=A0A2T4U8T2_9BACI|nr:1,4-alpha-glucan branching protein GlgB [Alkalicoccus saliphilus]PTL39799.1 1,4-alpha-glucan branching enzyme [Alkalicoccus saliphilus]